MRSFPIGSTLRIFALTLFAGVLAACGGRGVQPDMLNQGASVPAGFDLTLVADKDNQFDLDGAPLTTEDLKSAIRYRQEEKLPMTSVILKRGEKEKVKNEHIVALARLAYEMKFSAYLMEKDGQISELRAQMKEPSGDAAKQ